MVEKSYIKPRFSPNKTLAAIYCPVFQKIQVVQPKCQLLAIFNTVDGIRRLVNIAEKSYPTSIFSLSVIPKTFEFQCHLFEIIGKQCFATVVPFSSTLYSDFHTLRETCVVFTRRIIPVARSPDV